MKKYTFPDGFLWGTSTSAHQIEGNNTNNDWWRWEQVKFGVTPIADREYPTEPSGIACDSYRRYEEDFDLCVQLNNNAVRFSIEWARIEPDEGIFSEKEFKHYRKVLEAAKSRGLKTFVTLHHFTNPVWFSDIGGWRNRKAAHFFARYAKKCAEELGDLIDVFLTINEPQVYIYMSYMRGIWPPSKVNPILALLVQFNMIKAHRNAYDAIKHVQKTAQVGIVKNIVWYETYSHKLHFLDKIVVRILYFLGNDAFIRPIHGKLDLIGLNYYFTNRISNFRTTNPNDKVSDLGWWMYPKGLEKVLVDLKRYNLPIYVTENGLADEKDKYRTWFIKEMLKSCANAIKKGVPLKGYFHWSLIDNYEWHHGFWPRFGLVEIDRNDNLKRKPRDSFNIYANICKMNSIDA